MLVSVLGGETGKMAGIVYEAEKLSVWFGRERVIDGAKSGVRITRYVGHVRACHPIRIRWSAEILSQWRRLPSKT